MTDVLCSIMGALDMIAGIIIMVAFEGSQIGIVLGMIMIIKGVFSFL